MSRPITARARDCSGRLLVCTAARSNCRLDGTQAHAGIVYVVFTLGLSSVRLGSFLVASRSIGERTPFHPVATLYRGFYHLVASRVAAKWQAGSFGALFVVHRERDEQLSKTRRQTTGREIPTLLELQEKVPGIPY